jgi:hypothetical protein
MRKCFPVFRERKNRNCCHFWKKSAVTGKSDIKKMKPHANMGTATDTGMDMGKTAGTMMVTDTGMTENSVADMGIVMTADTMEPQTSMEDADHVEIYQKVSALCHYCRSVHDQRGDDGSAAAGIYEPDCG